MIFFIFNYKMENEETDPLLEHEEKDDDDDDDDDDGDDDTQPILSNLEEHQHQGPQAKKFQ